MRSVCGLSARSKQTMALKYNPSRLTLTAGNLKEINVGKIICQGSIESSRRGTCIFFCITLRINWTMICAFEVCVFCFKCDNNASNIFWRKSRVSLLYIKRVVQLSYLQLWEGQLHLITSLHVFLLGGLLWFITAKDLFPCSHNCQ